MTLPTVTLTGTGYFPDGSPAAGKKLILSLQAALRDDADEATIFPEKITITLDGDGQIPDGTEIVPSSLFDPSPVSYKVREYFGLNRAYYVEIPDTGPVDLFGLAPLDGATDPIASYATIEELEDAVAASEEADDTLTAAISAAQAAAISTAAADATSKITALGLGTASTHPATDFLTVGTTKIDVTGKYGNDLNAAVTAEGAGKHYVLSSPTTLLHEVALGDWTTLECVGAAKLIATGGTTKFTDTQMIRNADLTNGNTGIRLIGLLDGNRANNGGQSFRGIYLYRCSNSDVLMDVQSMPSRGIMLEGYSSQPKPRYIRVRSHVDDCGDYSVICTDGRRDVEWDLLVTNGRGTSAAVYLDASEQRGKIVVRLCAGNGIQTNNIFGCNLEMEAYSCQNHGVVLKQYVGSYAKIKSHNNGQASGGVSGSGYADIFVSDDFTQSYGANAESTIEFEAGPLSSYGGQTIYGPPTEDHGLYVADGNGTNAGVTDLKLKSLRDIGPGCLVSGVRMPAAANLGLSLVFPERVVYLHADTAGKTNGTLADLTGTDGTQLAANLQAGGVYEGSYEIVADGDSSADLKLGWSLPSGATMSWMPDDYVATTSAGAASGTIARSVLDQTATHTTGLVATTSGTPVGARGTFIIFMGSTSGTAKMQYAQGSANAAATVVKKGSRLRTRRVG